MTPAEYRDGDLAVYHGGTWHQLPRGADRAAHDALMAARAEVDPVLAATVLRALILHGDDHDSPHLAAIVAAARGVLDGITTHDVIQDIAHDLDEAIIALQSQHYDEADRLLVRLFNGLPVTVPSHHGGKP